MDFPARIHAIFARNSDKAVVFRRGPSDKVAVLAWDRKNDTFMLGNGSADASTNTVATFLRMDAICFTSPQNTGGKIQWKQKLNVWLQNVSVNSTGITEMIPATGNI